MPGLEKKQRVRNMSLELCISIVLMFAQYFGFSFLWVFLLLSK